MAERRRSKAARGARRQPAPPALRPPERATAAAPPEPLAFPWASALAIGWGALPVRPVPPPRDAPPAPPRRRRVAE